MLHSRRAIGAFAAERSAMQQVCRPAAVARLLPSLALTHPLRSGVPRQYPTTKAPLFLQPKQTQWLGGASGASADGVGSLSVFPPCSALISAAGLSASIECLQRLRPVDVLKLSNLVLHMAACTCSRCADRNAAAMLCRTSVAIQPAGSSRGPARTVFKR